MDNEEADAPAPSSAPIRFDHDGARSSNRGAIAVAVLMFGLGGVIGLLSGLLLGDDGDGIVAVQTGGDEVEIDCGEAESLVDAAATQLEVINESDVQNASFFAALLVEQRKIVFAMAQAPTCFSLDDRAGAEGLLEGLNALAASSGPLPDQQAPALEEGE